MAESEPAAQEPVKIKMTLHAARPSVQGAAPPRPAAQAAVEAVEARWRAEDRKVKTERRKKRFVGCLSWFFILLAAAGAAWYFLGPKYLPAEYTFPQVWPKVQELWGGTTSGNDAPHPADAVLAGQRARLGGFVDLLDKACQTAPPIQSVAGLEGQMKQSSGRKILSAIVSADAVYAQAQKRFADMNAKNENLASKPGEENRHHINQYSAQDLLRQQNRVEELGLECLAVRKKAVKRAYEAVVSATAKWTGPESKRDAARVKARLEALARKLAGK